MAVLLVLGIVHVHKKNEYLGSLSAGGRLISAITDKTHNKHLNHCPLSPFQTPHLPTPTLLFGANAQAYGEMCYMRSALSQGKRSCRRSALCCLCLLSHFLFFFITFNTYSRYEPGEATQWRYADVWAFRSGTY